MAKKKRPLSPTLKAWNMCRLKLGVKPFEKATPQQRDQLRDCVDEATGKKKRPARGKARR